MHAELSFNAAAKLSLQSLPKCLVLCEFTCFLVFSVIPGAFPWASGAVQEAICLVHHSLYLVLHTLPQLIGVVDEAHALLACSVCHLYVAGQMLWIFWCF